MAIEQLLGNSGIRRIGVKFPRPQFFLHHSSPIHFLHSHVCKREEFRELAIEIDFKLGFLCFSG